MSDATPAYVVSYSDQLKAHIDSIPVEDRELLVNYLVDTTMDSLRHMTRILLKITALTVPSRLHKVGTEVDALMNDHFMTQLLIASVTQPRIEALVEGMSDEQRQELSSAEAERVFPKLEELHAIVKQFADVSRHSDG